MAGVLNVSPSFRWSFTPYTLAFFFVLIQGAISQAYSRLLPKTDQSPPPPNQFLCQLSNISQCLEIDGQEQVTITSFHSL
jgi:hypothetical protein